MFGSRSGVGFGGTIDYDRDLDGRHDKDARIIHARGVDVFYNADGRLDADSRQLARSFRAQAMMNPDVKKCVKHLWISYNPKDQLAMINNAFRGKRRFVSLEDAIKQLRQQRVNAITDKAMVDDTIRLLEKMGYDQTQFLIVRHSEKDNPHVHVILNMVDNEGNRLKDFQEKKRGIAICKQITLDRHYTWGEHKSASETVSNNPRENARAEICKHVFDITLLASPDYPITAEELKEEAQCRNIEIKFLTNYKTGVITGISFAKDGFLFPANKVDASLSADKLFPSQVESPVPLSKLSEESQSIVKAGGIVEGFNNQKIIQEAKAPELPQSVQESRVRDEYHAAIDQAMKEGSRTAYMQNVAGLALDPKCGPSEERAEAVSAYIKHVADDGTGQAADVLRVNEIIRLADEQKRAKKTLFQRLFGFLRNLLLESMELKKYPIIAEEGRKDIWWSDLRDGLPGKLVGLAREVQTSIEDAYKEKMEKLRKQKEKPAPAPRQTPAQDYGQTTAPPMRPSIQAKPKPKEEKNTTGVKHSR